MKKVIVYTILWMGIAFSISSCSKKSDKVTPLIKDTTTTTTGTPGTTDVYVAGYEVNTQNQLVAVYWKNGTEVKLPGGQATKCLARAIFVSGNDVYVAGSVGAQACYWKNGVLNGLQSLLDTLQATSIYVANGNVYVGVSQPVIYEAQLTHPGQYFIISAANGQQGYGLGQNLQLQQSGIYASGTDVYNSGSYSIKGGIDFGAEYYLPQACYWKNGNTQVVLPFEFNFSYYYSTNSRSLFSYAATIAVSGSDVYTAGNVGWAYPNDNTSGTAYPAYWENNTAYMLGEQTVNGLPTFPLGTASSICLSGSDVYIGGTVYQNNTNSACFWKNNGTTTFLPRQGDYAEGNSISVSGSDVYMAGTDYTSNPETYKACYWKNGAETTLSTATYSKANSIFIVKH